MKDLLLLLGTPARIHELATAKKWSQEEFAHVSGLHRTYIGQIELGEKNISFGNQGDDAAFLPRSGHASYKKGTDAISFGPLLREHSYVAVRGAEP